MPTSSANPGKLSSYSTDGLELVQTLTNKSDAVTSAIESLSASGSPHLPALGDAHTTLSDLAGDWLHLDTFVGDVAQGFLLADGGDTNGVITLLDADIATQGQVGFADRDEAIVAAQQAANRLEELLSQHPDDIDPAELSALLDDIQRGQYDPAFAVTFSEDVGVAGYVDAMTLIQNVYDTTEGEYRVTEQGLAYAAVLGMTLNTALDTVYQDDEDYNDPDNAALPGDQRLDYGFIEQLATGYQGSDHAIFGPYNGDPEDYRPVRNAEGWELDRNLSVLLSYTDPPTWVGVDIANGRLSPALEGHWMDTGTGPNALVWGDRSGAVTNYATMLSHNEDASTLWLYSESEHGDNVELLLDRTTARDMDGGAALAEIVENGLTNDDLHEPVPGAPSYVEGRPMREALMERVIDHTAELGEINNGHLNGAFAAGVDANMNVIDERINAPFGYNEGARPDGVLDEYRNTHDFLRETMRDVDAAYDIRQTVHEYGFEQAGSLPGDAEEREARLRQLGRVQGMVTEAEQNAGVGAALDEMMSDSPLGPTPGSATNYVLGQIPVFGTVHDIAAGMGVGGGNGVDWLIGELGDDFEQLDAAEREARVNRAEDRLNRALWVSTGLYEANTPQGEALRESAQGQPFVNPDGSIKTSMTAEEAQAYREWAVEMAGNDDDQGPIYTEHGDVGTGVNDVHEGETDVTDRD